MLKNISAMEVKRGENFHQYQVPQGCSIGEVLDVLTEFRGFALNLLIQEQKKSEEQISEMKKQLEQQTEPANVQE